MKIIPVANQKGGVGKTTLAENLAAAFASAEQRTLLIDFDPQGNAATFLGLYPEPGAYNLLATQIPALRTLIRGNVAAHVRAFLRPTGRENFDLLPGDHNTATAQALIVSGERDLALIRRAIQIFRGQYDIVILDTAPSLGGILELALYSGDYVLLPAACETASLEGVRQTIETLQVLTQKHNWQGRLLGVVPTFFDERTIERKQSLKDLKQAFPGLVFPPIHEAAAIRELPSNQMTIFEKAAAEKGNRYASRAAEEFHALVREIERRL
jgi:chromosome partitioning protein